MREAFKVEVSLRSIFEEPQLAGQAARVEALLRGEAAEVLPLKRATRDQGPVVLSYSQERLWFLDQLQPNTSAYNVSAVMRVRGELKVNALAQSFAEVIRRHEALRTTFEIMDGEPAQVITAGTFQLIETDLTGIPEPDRMAAVRRLANEESERPFDLQRGPLLRAGLLRLAADDHVLLLTIHHIIGDAWSMGVLMRELRMFYDGYARGESPSSPELPVQYADYAIWQREWLSGEELAKQLHYWKNQLSGAPTVLELPADRPRPALESHRGGNKSFLLRAELLEGLAQLSRREGATLFMTLLAAFQTLLYRYSGQEDIVVGTPIANRSRAEVEGLIGFFLNTLVMRARITPQMSFRTLLANTRETALQAYTHQDVPFEKLVEELQPERNLSHQPLFQVLFVLQNVPREEFRLHELEVQSLGSRSRTAKFDLTLFLAETSQGLAGSIEYNTDLFDAGTIERMCGHFETLLQGIVDNDRQRLSQLPLLTKAEREQLGEWNQTEFKYPETHCVHEAVEAQAEKTPDAPAIVFDDQQITYRELNERANQLAHYLISIGVRPEVRVGICLERSFAMLTAVLGVLKAGGAYVSLDPSYPPERLKFMMQDADINILLTETQLQERFGEHHCRTVLLDADQELFDRESTANVSSGVTPDNLVYVIFTSGSTGRPKGVTMSHRSLANLLSWQVETYPNDAAARTLQFTSLSFDVSFQEIF
ncbi:MAG TPA: condensation domain-containing protein, partial [Pyrinomonadaceae bacterium]|nr:condensation domain-containing protein [Pyrinomonadaceae bacterium]